MTRFFARVRRPRLLAATALSVALSACASFGGSGPSTGAIRRAGGEAHAGVGIQVIDLDDAVVRRGASFAQSQRFGDIFGQVAPVGSMIGTGDVLDIAIWEAPPAVLFGASGAGGGSLAQSVGIPQQSVGEDGSVLVPFVGALQVRGRTPQEVGRMIVARLAGRAHSPQVIVRLAQNDSRAVTVMGEVGATRRLPLTPRGERLLDALAAAGGARQPVGKVTMQLTRDGRTASMPLDTIIRDPAQNVMLKPGDVVTALFQPFSFIALGAIGQNAEVPFEGGGLSLTQALGRVGGLRDDRASVRGVFVFRMEDPAALPADMAATAPRTNAGRVPVIYRLNMSQGEAFFIAQNFEVQNRDVIYVSNAPLADFQKFLNAVSNAAFSVIGLSNALN